MDVGSNSVLLVVAEWTGADWVPLIETSEVTGLGAGTKQTGILTASSIESTLRAVKRAFATASIERAPCRAFGTMALRIAKNAGKFVQQAAAQGTPVEVLPAEEEARLGLECVLFDPLFASHLRITVVDVGGNSTEISSAEREAGSHTWRTLFVSSLPVGTLGLRSGPLRPETPTPRNLARAAAEVDDTLAFDVPEPSGLVVGLGASATNLVSIRDLVVPWSPDRVHGAFLSVHEIAEAVRNLSSLTEAQRAALPGIEPGREGTVHAGGLILERVLRRLGAQGCRVSVRGWRHAMLNRLA